MAKPVVLIVEDEPLVLMVSAETLRDAGLVVIEACTADEAATLLEKIAADVTVVFTDIEMPGRLDGLMLVEKINREWPALPVILTSGNVFPMKDALQPEVRFIAKPYDLEVVRSLIIELAQARATELN